MSESPREVFKRTIESLLTTEGISFNKASIAILKAPCVYLFLKKGVVLYIGMSSNGVARAMGKHKPNFMEKYTTDSLADADELILFQAKDIAMAHKAELLLIQSLKPRLNVAHTDRARSSKRIRELLDEHGRYDKSLGPL